MNMIRFFNTVSLQDIALVGGKGASLGQLTQTLVPLGVLVPYGFVVTTDAYRLFLKNNQLDGSITALLQNLDLNNLEQLELVSEQIKHLINLATVPQELYDQIKQAYKELESRYGAFCDVAVRSSATAEDLPEASFAGQQDSYLNVVGVQAIVDSWKHCCASLFNARAISYRARYGVSNDIALAVVVQKMVRSDLATAGVMFTLDTETGFDKVFYITGSYGLGESVVQGSINPDECYVYKPTFMQGYPSILKKRTGSKQSKLIYDSLSRIKKVELLVEDQRRFCLSDEQILILAKAATVIETEYKKLLGDQTSLDIEWAQDGNDGQFYIVQVRPETVHSLKKTEQVVDEYHFAPNVLKNAKMIAVGKSVSKSVVVGTARVVKYLHQAKDIAPGQIIVTDMTDPDWEPVMKRSLGIVTNRGGRTCHAAIVSRELGICAIVGTGNGTESIVDGQLITLDSKSSDQGAVYEGALEFTKQNVVIDNLPVPKVPLMLNLANPDQAFEVAKIPNAGVGLLRLEFIINTAIKVHPMALVQFEKVTGVQDRQQIEALTFEFKDKTEYFVTKLAQEVSTIAAAFFPKPVIVRLSDFKSNEYANLLGGTYFEQAEENPMLGFRGASRYYHPAYAPAFALECKALKKVRNELGFTNLIIMVPFVRTVAEAKLVTELMAQHGLIRGECGLELYMMCEIPSNVLLLSKFAEFFDGFSIGSNDLTQMTLAVDRDSGILTEFNELDEAVTMMIEMAVTAAHKAQKKIGICGQAPSDFPQFAIWLESLGIDSISLTQDSVIKTMVALGQKRL